MVSPRRRRQPAHGARVAAATDAVEAAEPGPEAAVVAISLDGVLWLALVVIAAALRFVSLDRLPFSEAESARAFAAWAVSEGSVPDGWPGDVTAALTSHLFRIFGSSETVARIIPAIAGSALVASFWFAGRYVGRGVALLAAALIALSPLAVYTSRSAFGFALGGFLSMAMVLSLLAYVERPRQTPAVVLAAAFGLALASDPVATATAIAIAAFVAIEGAWRRGAAVSEAAAAFRSNRDHWQPAALALAAALAMGVVQLGTDIDRAQPSRPPPVGGDVRPAARRPALALPALPAPRLRVAAPPRRRRRLPAPDRPLAATGRSPPGPSGCWPSGRRWRS